MMKKSCLKFLNLLSKNRKIHFASSDLIKWKGIQKGYEITGKSCSICFYKNDVIYAVKINASRMQFDGVVQDLNAIGLNWSVIHLTSLAIYNYSMSYDPELEALIKQIPRDVLNTLTYSRYHLIIKNYIFRKICYMRIRWFSAEHSVW